MNRKAGLIILCIVALIVIAGGVYMLVDGNKQFAIISQATPTPTSNQTVITASATPITVSATTPTASVTGTTTPSATVSATADFSKYSINSQNVGFDTSKSNNVTGLTNSAGTGYHRFVFSLKSNDTTPLLPSVIAEDKPYSGAIRITIKSITDDKSGIALQDAVNINKDGIVRIYHTITGTEGQSVYEIGVSKDTPFLLSNKEIAKGQWEVYLDVKYPGTVTSTVDTGSTAFSKLKQEIKGATSAENGSVAGYSFSASGGVFEMDFVVSGNESKPLPSCTAQYTGGKLVLNFPSLSWDVFGSTYDKTENIAGVNVRRYRTGTSTVYEYNVSDKEFRLSGTTNPNTVVMEIKL